MNAISHDTAINLIKSVKKMGVNVKKVYVDTVGPPHVYQEKLQVSILGIILSYQSTVGTHQMNAKYVGFGEIFLWFKIALCNKFSQCCIHISYYESESRLIFLIGYDMYIFSWCNTYYL